MSYATVNTVFGVFHRHSSLRNSMISTLTILATLRDSFPIPFVLPLQCYFSYLDFTHIALNGREYLWYMIWSMRCLLSIALVENQSFEKERCDLMFSKHELITCNPNLIHFRNYFFLSEQRLHYANKIRTRCVCNGPGYVGRTLSVP